jgi:hypothetical protein
MTLQEALQERLELIEDIKLVFAQLNPGNPAKVRRGQTQAGILNCLGMPADGVNRRIVSEALRELGYRAVKVEGFRFYRRRVS